MVSRSWPPGRTPTTAILAGREADAAGVLDLEALAHLLHLSMRVVREAVRRDGRHYRLRATGSAGGLFPYEAYVAARGVPGLPDGVDWLDPLGPRLVSVGPAPDGRSTTLVLTGIPWRTGWRSTERGYRHLYWTSARSWSQLVAVAHQLGLPEVIRMVFPHTSVTPAGGCRWGAGPGRSTPATATSYRGAQLDAGPVSGRLHLAAVALGIAATGMTFVDGEIPALVGEPLAALLLTCVGVPAYKHGPAARPDSRSRSRPRRFATGWADLQRDPERTRQVGRGEAASATRRGPGKKGEAPSTGPVGDPTPRNDEPEDALDRKSDHRLWMGPVLSPWEVCAPSPMPAQRWFVRARRVVERRGDDNSGEASNGGGGPARRPLPVGLGGRATMRACSRPRRSPTARGC